VLGAGKDQHRLALDALEHLREQRGLQMRGYVVKGVRHAVHRRVVRHRNGNRVVQDLMRQPADVAGHGRGEEQGLTLGRELPDDAPDIRQEAHIEHLIGLVQHQNLDALQINVSLFDMVQQAAGAGHHDVRAAAKLFLSAGECPHRRKG